MEYSFRPPWRQKKFNFPSCQHPVCGRCGNVHPNVSCFAIHQKCYRCHRMGHYSRICFTQIKKTEPKPVNKGPVPSKRKLRDMKRLSKFLENKRVLRELPFNSVRDSQFRLYCDTSSNLRTELKHLKKQLHMCKEQGRSMAVKLKTAESEIKKLQNDNREMENKLKQQTNNSKEMLYLKTIQKLKEDAQADKVLMDLMQKKLNDIGKDYSQYMMKIQEDAEKTAKQLRGQNNALLQTIEELKDERDDLESIILEKQRPFQSRRCQGKPRRGRFY